MRALGTLALLSLLPLFPRPAAAGIQPEADRKLGEGLDCLFRMQYAEAEAAVAEAMRADPEHPYPRLGLAAVAWTRYIYETEQSDPALLAPLEGRIKEAVAAAGKRLKADPKDAEGLLALGGAYGLSSRLALMRKEWVRGYLQGRKAIAMAKAAAKADPSLWDARLATGMYDYYTDLYPRFIGVLARLVLRGDRARAVRTLTDVAAKGHYARGPAKVLLIEIFTEDPYGAKDPDKALALARELRAEHPGSALMHWGELLALYAGARHAEAADSARDFVAKCDAGSYHPLQKAKALVLLGLSEWSLGRTAEALDALRAATKIEVAGRPSRWAVWAHIKAGELEDALGRRDAALADYRAALAQPDAWGLHKLAKAGVARPFRGASPAFVTPP